MDEVVRKLCTQLEGAHLKCRVVSIRHLPELQEDLTGFHARGSFNGDFFQERLTFFDFSPPDDLPAARSLIVVAVPRPQTRVKFTWQGKTRRLIFPPTYLGHSRISRQINELLEKLLAPFGYRVIPARLPQKLLAVHSGLAEYGRNNICYIPGFGSFFQPTVFFSDLPCEEDDWRELRSMERCQSCKACMLKCPTGAITEERFLLHAERCLVFHNERPGGIPFPSWIDRSAHNCLMGCMICQKFCPENKPVLNWFEGDEKFSNEETTLLMEGASREQFPAGMVKKLERLELLEDLDKLPRNLDVFFSRSR